MNKKPDIVSLKWVIGLMQNQADAAEAALVEFGNDTSQKQALLRCMWAVHQITSTLKALGMRKAEYLTLEMERSLNYLYKDKLSPERAKLAMGGVMQGLKLIPAYLEHTECERLDTGRGLERYVNDLRRWIGEKPKARGFFFHLAIEPGAGITEGAEQASDEEIVSRANVMLAPYLEMAKQGLKRRNVAESMKTVARVARKMQMLFRGSETERFWFTMIGLCEGMAAGLVQPDECIAQVFKAGAFTIKHARENGASIDASIDYDSYVTQMLYYVAASKGSPVHITAVRSAFGIDENTLDEANRGLVHNDAIEIALQGAYDQLSTVMEFVQTTELAALAATPEDQCDESVLDAVEAAQHRLVAAGQMEHAETLKTVRSQFNWLFQNNGEVSSGKLRAAIDKITDGIVNVVQDLEHKLKYGMNSNFSGQEFELRRSVADATFRQMGLVENNLHRILRRKALGAAIAAKPADDMALLRLTCALQRYLNKSDQGYEELREQIRRADNGEADIDALFALAQDFTAELEQISEQDCLQDSLALLEEISGALMFSGMAEEGQVMERCHTWLAAAADAGAVSEDDAFRCFADAFAHIEMHLQRSLLDPLDDTSHMLALAVQRSEELERMSEVAAMPQRLLTPVVTAPAEPATKKITTIPPAAAKKQEIEDDDITPEFREVFMEESEEIIEELQTLLPDWLNSRGADETLKEIRRHFHTFKGNGRAVGANVLGELGWSVQDMLDRVLDGELVVSDQLVGLLEEVVNALPELLAAYCASEEPDLRRVRLLTQACFASARGESVVLAELTRTAGVAPTADEVAVAMPATEPLAH
ncbi:MAG: hypothetical protein HKN19_15420 [Halioglobus sp.]|nr:hypothetical protein [Halioglobus sp.]